jgi:hypothetical protein
MKRGILLLICFAWAAGSGCATSGQTGAVAGAGVGALMGQLIGRNTASTLIGAGIGTGLGYIIGNEKDKMDAQGRQTVRIEETEPLGGTVWQVISVNPKPKPVFKSIVSHFKKDGTVVTTKIYRDDRVETDVERFRIVGSTLIVNKSDYVINARFRIDGNQMTMDTGEYSVVLKRVDL